MKSETNLNRRFFMQGTGAAALLGSVSFGTSSSFAAGMGQSSSMSAGVDFDAGFNRVGTNSIKFDYIKMINPGKELDVGMGIADMDFKTLPQVTAALKERLETENWGYELPPLDMPANIASWNKRRYGADVPQKNVLNCVGVLDGVLSILNSFGEEGDKILLQTPTYSSFFTTIHQANMHEAESELKMVNGRYEVDYDDFEAQIAGGIKMFILCNPQNPTGNCWSEAELRKMGDICNKYDCLVIADEIHCDFVMGSNKYFPYAELGDAYAQNSISLKSTSKSFNLASHRTGYLFSHNRAHIDKVLKGGHQRLLLNIMGMIAANTALKHGDDYIDQQNAYLTANSHYAAKYFADNIPTIKYQPHEGTYLAWLDVRGLIAKLDAESKAKELTDYNVANNITTTDILGNTKVKTYNAGDYLKEWVMDNAKIDINPGENYGKGGAGYMRMNLATNRKTLTRAFNNLEKAINAI
ncbi:MAG: aminotransferase class I/II-fold pyridoxal phosphate-dependent enzyme [Emcibacteraceae bacterium]|nr:aminotransferase class I/II-fold pyridoxal phosphate-dependent enzyme [Emcibacteraceae bacterium]MDG1995416.1 aminotransferase class I/II-fold pyridoxal phosphate-dependent enzyme [Emcibacteraceae bacterium]